MVPTVFNGTLPLCGSNKWYRSFTLHGLTFKTLSFMMFTYAYTALIAIHIQRSKVSLRLSGSFIVPLKCSRNHNTLNSCIRIHTNWLFVCHVWNRLFVCHVWNLWANYEPWGTQSPWVMSHSIHDLSSPAVVDCNLRFGLHFEPWWYAFNFAGKIMQFSAMLWHNLLSRNINIHVHVC